MSYMLTLEEEKIELLRRYRKLLRHAKPNLKEGDTKVIRKAFDTAVEAHKDMRRKSGEPYIFHPIAVAQIVVEEIGLGTTSVVAALLHDVVEDTELTLDDIQKSFGRKVAKIIDGLTKISSGFDVDGSPQAENFRKMLLTISDDVRVILVKLADRLHNMRTLESMQRHKQLKIASETIYIYAPLAHRLGLYSIKSELEDLYLKYTEPDTYYFIANKINETKTSRNKFVREFIRPIQEELRKTYMDFTIKGRPKSIFSIWNKMHKQNIPFEEVYDLFAIRIIVNCTEEKEKANCWQVYSIVTDNYHPNPSRLRDWISTPKTNGYESLHTTVMSKSGKWVEVQVRSKRMDDVAEKGYAAHWKYKEGDDDGSKKTKITALDEWIAKVRDMLKYENSNALEFVDDFRSSFYNKEIFVFTPKGDLKVLPNGSTALDFAFEVHTDIGLHCKGAKINHKLVPLSHVLKNGDQVEVIAHDSQKPSEDWKKIVKTTKAKKILKDYFNGTQKTIEAHGKEIFDKFAKKHKIKAPEEFLEEVRKHFNYDSSKKIFNDLGRRIFLETNLKDFLNKPDDTAKPKSEEHEDFNFTERKIKNIAKQELVIGSGISDLKYSFAQCCNPIAGEDVFGFVTISDGIKIHRTNCVNATELMSSYGYRVIKARWEEDLHKKFLAKIKIIGTDRIGMMNDLTGVISSTHGVNIKRLRAETYENIIEDEFHLEVENKQLLEQLFSELIRVDGVMSVERLEE